MRRDVVRSMKIEYASEVGVKRWAVDVEGHGGERQTVWVEVKAERGGADGERGDNGVREGRAITVKGYRRGKGEGRGGGRLL